MKYNQLTDTLTKHYIDKNVYEAAKERINYSIDHSDTLVVSCSGGKDSLVVLKLVEEIYEERGIDEKVNVVFHDEEVIPNHVVEFLEELHDSGKYNFIWLAVPLYSNKYNTGSTEQYIQWDPNRKHVREPPEYALTLEDLNLPPNSVVDQYNLNKIYLRFFEGTVCFCDGLRAQESLYRLGAILRRKEPSFLSGKEGRSFHCSPIYDWMTEDVFLYFYKKDINYSQVYNHQLWAGIELRVATPLHSEARRTFNKLRYLDPEFYERICEVFPDMYHADRYNGELVRKISFDDYDHGPKGLYKYIDDNYKGQQRDLAYSRIKTVVKRRFRKKIENPKDVMGGYPYLYLFEVLSQGGIKRAILPCPNINQKHFEFEGYSEKDYLEYMNNRIESQNFKFS